MRGGYWRLWVLVIGLFVAACAGDATTPHLIGDNNGNDTALPDVGRGGEDDVGDLPDTDVPDTGGEPDTGELPDVTPQPDGGDDVEPGPQSCEAHADCTAPEICIVDAATGAGECGPSTGDGGDGASCTDGSQCTSGLCREGACATRCETTADCEDGRVCKPVELGARAVELCVDPAPCVSSAGCEAPEVCTVRRGADAVEVVCLEPGPGGGEVGDACTDDAQCSSNLCLEGQCSAPCERTSDCSSDGSYVCTTETLTSGTGEEREVNVCTPKPPQACISDAGCAAPERCVARVTGEGVMFVCGAPNAGGGEGGEGCADDADCAHNLCHDGQCANACGGNNHCDTANDLSCKATTIERGGHSGSLNVCVPPQLCERNAECVVGQVCYIRQDPTVIKTFCRQGNPAGRQLGQACTEDTQCGSNLCLDDRFRDHCTVACVTDNDCAVAGSAVQYECRAVDFSLSGGGSDTARVCVAKAPEPCASPADCVAGPNGTACAIVPDEGGAGLESVCIPNPGGAGPGAACTADSQCTSQLCLGGFCSVPCTDSIQCGPGQICRENDVSRGGLSGRFRVCETLPDVRCGSSRECTDGVRVCSDISRPDGEYCRFPNTGGRPLGSSCSAGSQCYEGLCLLGVSDECSVVCQNSALDCGTGQICTSFGPDLNLCNTACTNDAGCGAGRVCTTNSNYPANDIDKICVTPYGPKTLGEVCASGDECASGLCLETTLHSSNGQSCTSDSACPSGHSCVCPLSNPSCTSGKQCTVVTVENHCTSLCDPANGNQDCAGGGPGNVLTACSTSIGINRPVTGRTTIAACSKPSN